MTLPMRGSIFASVLNKPLGLFVSAFSPKGTGVEESYDEKMGRMRREGPSHRSLANRETCMIICCYFGGNVEFPASYYRHVGGDTRNKLDVVKLN